ncbi:hypothetical protein BASA81_012372 [Batrachochytrium salamandrivorans]|nr:hypothetical protein BASA81_012372 [Batrachochytrium salamandrivorans]
MNSDEELESASSFEEDSDLDEERELDLDLARDGKNVGRSLRNDLELLSQKQTNKRVGKVDEVFDAKFQLPLGKTSKRRRVQEEDEQIDLEMEEWLANQSLDSSEDEEPVAPLRSSAPLAVNPKHVRNQRKTEAELMGLRIHLQPLVELSRKLGDGPHPAAAGGVRSLYKILLQTRQLIVANGQPLELLEAMDLKDFSWEALQRTEQALWEHHIQVIAAAEQRLQLTSTAKKQLKAMNRTAVEQTEAAIERKREIGTQAFFPDETDFYSQLLRDFVSTRASSVPSSATVRNSEHKLKRRSQRDYHKAKKEESKMNYQVHDKLVNFIAPIVLSQPTIDIDQFVKSLFQ